jgi:hypothetical protein
MQYTRRTNNKEWSDRGSDLLRPRGITRLASRSLTRCVVLACVYLGALGFLGASFEAYRHWLRTTEAVAGEPVRKVDRWTAYCRVKPWTRGCRSVPGAGRRQVAPVVTAGAAAVSVANRSGLEGDRSPSYTFSAAMSRTSSVR